MKSFPAPTPIDEVYLKRKDIAKPKEKQGPNGTNKTGVTEPGVVDSALDRYWIYPAAIAAAGAGTALFHSEVQWC